MARPTVVFNWLNDEHPYLYIIEFAGQQAVVPVSQADVVDAYREHDAVLLEERKARHQFPDPVPGCACVVSCSRCPAEQAQAGDGSVAPVGDAVDWCPPEARP